MKVSRWHKAKARLSSLGWFLVMAYVLPFIGGLLVILLNSQWTQGLFTLCLFLGWVWVALEVFKRIDKVNKENGWGKYRGKK